MAPVTVNQLTVTILVRHEVGYGSSRNVSRLVVAFTQRRKDFAWDDARVSPRGCDGINADRQFGVEMPVEGTEETKDSVFGSR